MDQIGGYQPENRKDSVNRRKIGHNRKMGGQIRRKFKNRDIGEGAY